MFRLYLNLGQILFFFSLRYEHFRLDLWKERNVLLFPLYFGVKSPNLNLILPI